MNKSVPNIYFMKTLAILHSTVRAEEKMLLKAGQGRGLVVKLIDIREQIFNPDTFIVDFDIALERSVSTVKGTYAVRFLEAMNIPVVNSSPISSICEDKFITSLILRRAHVQTPQFALVFGIDQAKEAVEQLGGFPVVVKPNGGSWGRLLAKINDMDSLEAIIEHKDVLGSPQQKAIYMQAYVDKPGRDIRAFVINGKAICAIYRASEHWITNTARGAEATNCPITKEMATLSKKASDAIGGGILAMDIFETDEGLMVNEVNHTMEFKNSEKPTGVSISGAIIDYCMEVLKHA
ncbi:MAG TPA: lysine biosynthesis protein LysX [Patescibacteria group bacterium]|nr:lysine biosynthesis protein LysX [Patescibacteria group bacterium]